jgi:phage terminase small subunit
MPTLVKKEATKPPEIPAPPRHLSTRMKQFWTWAHGIRELSEKDRLLLIKAGECFDECERCRRAVKKDGMTVIDRFGQRKPHPLLTVEQNAREQFAKLVMALNLQASELWPFA